MKRTLMTLGLICGLFLLMGATCNVNVVPAGTYGPSIGVLPPQGRFGQGLSYPLAGEGLPFGTGVPVIGSKMGFWTVY
jgi:hypothetical protein